MKFPNVYVFRSRCFVPAVLLLLAVLLFPALSHAQVSPANSWHAYGYVIQVYNGVDRVIFHLSTNDQRLECFPAETSGCFSIGQYHWIVADGYTQGVVSGCVDGPDNESHITKLQVWNYVTGQWETVSGPPQ